MIRATGGPCDAGILIVLCYHATSETWDSHLSVPPRAVELQVRRWHARGYRPGSAEEAAGGRGRLLHVTFDDAFLSIRDVMPLLERLGQSLDRLRLLGARGSGGRAGLTCPSSPPSSRTAPPSWSPWGGTTSATSLRRGVEVGAHTATHPHLTQLPSAELDDELRVSRERIEDELGRPCRIFAYPYGESDARVRAAARAGRLRGCLRPAGDDRLAGPVRPSSPSGSGEPTEGSNSR